MLEPGHPVRPFKTESPVSSTESARPSFQPRPSSQTYAQLLRFMHTQTPLPTSNFLCVRQLPALPPLCTTPGGTIHSRTREIMLCDLSQAWPCSRCVFGLFLWDRVGRVCFPQSGLSPPQPPTPDLTKE